MARTKAGFDHEYTDEVVCPHCGYEHGDSWDMRDGEQDCSECGKPFVMERYTTVKYTTEKLEGEG